MPIAEKKSYMFPMSKRNDVFSLFEQYEKLKLEARHWDVVRGADRNIYASFWYKYAVLTLRPFFQGTCWAFPRLFFHSEREFSCKATFSPFVLPIV